MNNSKTQLLHFLQKTNQIHSVKAMEIAEHFNEKIIAKGDFHLRENYTCNEYLFLDKGYMRAFAYNVEGADVTTEFYAAGQVVFEVSSFFKRTPSKENIQALTDCSGWYISYQQLNALFHSIPEFREFGRSVLVNGFASLKSRMLAMITATAEERYNVLLHHNPDIFQYAPLKNIATFLGVTDTSLSRIRKQVLKKG